ncbi:glycosyltransferase family 4 protein [Candidatus Woesearchaeota archaeon]|nr:glycosyltransferase family 4 protein [Candidatus Woesearchaeota archaeon]
MKIAYITAFYYPTIGGVEQVVKELAERYVKQGHEVHVFTSDWDKKSRIKIKEEIINGVHIHRHFHILKIASFASVFPFLLWTLSRYKFDIIHTHVSGHAHTFFGSLIAKIKNTPLIHTTHCPWTEGFRSLAGRILVYLSYKTINKLSFKFSNKIIAITPWEIPFIEKYGGKKEKIVIIPNGVAKIFFNKIKNNDFKKELKIKEPIVLFFGRLNPTKGPDKFVLAAKEILKERKNIKFLIVGPDEGMLNKVKELSKDEKNIIILDPIRNKEKIAKMYQSSNVFVLPSYREGLPLCLFEALASGLPIVASPVNGIPFEISDPENGFFVEYGDIQKLKEKILLLLDDKKLARKISKNNKEKAKNYDWDIIAERTLNLYKKIINKNL